MMVRKKGDWLTAQVGDDLVMMSVGEGRYLGLSEVGGRIWELLEQPQSVEALCEALLREFDVEPATCRAEVDAFLADLVKNGAATLEPVP